MNLSKQLHITSVMIGMMIIAFTPALSQNGIGINPTGAAADPSAMLDVSSTTKGILVPRMTAAQRGALVLPATGLMVYQTDGSAGYYFNTGTPVTPGWILVNDAAALTGTVPVASGGTGAANANNARGNLGAAASGANSDITSLTGLVTPIAVDGGGTGTSFFTSGYLKGNGVSPFSTVATIPGSDVTGNISGDAANFTGSLSGDVTGTQSATVVGTVGGATAANVASGANAANAATDANTVSTIVKRDASGNFSAGAITSDLTGNVTGNVSGTASNVTGTVAVPNGGTGATTLTGYIKGNGTSVMTAVSSIPGSDVSGNISGNAANVTGVVGISNGGTNNSAAYTSGSVLFFDGTKVAEKNSNLFWDNTNNRLGIGTTSPQTALQITGTVRSSTGFSSNDGTAGSPAHYFTSETSTGMWKPATGQIAFSSSGTEKIRMTATGLGVGTTAPAATFSVGTGATDKLQVAGAEGDVTLTDPLGSITFSATAGANSPMIQMFASGTSNADRMVISHSSGFNNYGLQYQDATDRFNFLSAGTNVATVDLTTQRMGIGVPAPAQKLDVSGNVQFTGTLMPGGSSGTAGQVLTSNVAATPTWTSGFLRSNYTIDFQTAAISTSTLSATGTLTGLSRAISLTAGDRVIIHAKAGIQAAVLGYGTIQLIARVNGSNLSNGTAGCVGVDDDAAYCNWNTGEVISIYDVPSTASYTFTTVYFVSRVSGTLTIGGGTNSVLQGVMELQVLKP